MSFRHRQLFYSIKPKIGLTANSLKLKIGARIAAKWSSSASSALYLLYK